MTHTCSKTKNKIGFEEVQPNLMGFASFGSLNSNVGLTGADLSLLATLLVQLGRV